MNNDRACWLERQRNELSTWVRILFGWQRSTASSNCSFPPLAQFAGACNPVEVLPLGPCSPCTLLPQW